LHVHSMHSTVPRYGGRIVQLPFQGTRLRTKTLQDKRNYRNKHLIPREHDLIPEKFLRYSDLHFCQDVCQVCFRILVGNSQNILCALGADIMICNTVRLLLQDRFWNSRVVNHRRIVNASMTVAFYWCSHHMKFL